MREIIEEINRRLGRAFEPLPTAEILGLVETVRLGGEQAFPAVIDERGEARPVFVDDRVDLTAYHRLAQKSYNAATASGYGDRPALTDSYEMSLVLSGLRAAIDPLRAVRLAEQALGSVSAKLYSTAPVAVAFNAAEVWQQEFRGTEFALPVNRFLVRLNYRIHHINTYC